LYFKEALKKGKTPNGVVFTRIVKTAPLHYLSFSNFELQAMRRSFRTWKTVD